MIYCPHCRGLKPFRYGIACMHHIQERDGNKRLVLLKDRHCAECNGFIDQEVVESNEEK